MGAPRNGLGEVTADLLGLADVHRWIVIRTGRHQSVAEHSFAVAVIAMELATRFGMAANSEMVAGILWWSLIHDAPETLTGDIDGKFKRDNPYAREYISRGEIAAFPWWNAAREAVPEGVRRIVKVADYIEALTFIHAWGKGARADDVYRELLAILFREELPRLVGWMNGGSVVDPVTERTVMGVLNSIMSEENSIQLRGK